MPKNKTSKPWLPGLKMNSKKVKLPKKYWEKGKSKFVDIRLHDEGCTSVNQLKVK